MSVEGNKAAVRAYFDAVRRGDRAGLLALFHPELRWSVPKGAAFVPGTQRVEIGLLLAEGGVVVAETRMTARRPGGAPDYENDYVFVFELAPDGRIAEIREHVDTRTAAQAFGG